MEKVIYPKVLTEFSLQQVRPIFHFKMQMSPKEFVVKFKKGLALPHIPCLGEVNETYGILYFPKDKTHYWLPELTLF